jgi:hypothetical protein
MNGSIGSYGDELRNVIKQRIVPNRNVLILRNEVSVILKMINLIYEIDMTKQKYVNLLRLKRVLSFTMRVLLILQNVYLKKIPE